MVSLIIFLFLYPPRPLQLVITIGVGLILLIFIPTSYYERILSLQDLVPNERGNINVRNDPAIQGRASEFLTGWLMYKENPVVGVGLSNYVTQYQEYTKRVGLAPEATPRSAHNLYLEVAAETGTLGISIFMVIIWLAMRSILIARKKLFEVDMDDSAHIVTAFAIAFCGYLIAALFVHAAYPRYFYLLIGIAFALSPMVNQLKDDTNKLVVRAS
jgi:O-antigen ligase